MGLLTSSFLFVTLILGLPAASQANHKYVFDFEHDLQDWTSQRGFWKWENEFTLQDNTIPSGYYGGFAVMDDKFSSDELYTPYFIAPKGGNFTMKFYLRSEYIKSNDLKVYTRNRQGIVTQFMNLKDYSLTTTTSWTMTQKELSPETEDIRFEIFCYNGAKAPAGEPLRGCAIDQITFEVYSDSTTAVPTTAPPTTAPPTTAAPTTAAPTTAAPTTAPPTTAAPTTPAPTTAAPTTPAPTTAAPTTAPPTTPAPTTAAPTTAHPTTAAPTTAPPTTAAPTTAPPTTAPPTTAAPTTAPPTTAAPTTAVSTTAAPTTPAPTTAAPTTAAPTTAAPTTPAPTTAPPTTAAPTTAAPTTAPPTTAAPTTAAPTTAAPTTAAPTTPAPTTAAPTTAAPTTAAPTTAPPTTAAPTTAAPTTAPPTTVDPTTPAPTTPAPTTAAPTTAAPTTAPPTTADPTTPAPTTAAPTTEAPTTAAPTTAAPTTAAPTTAAPTTAAPTTAASSTAAPTTAAPTTAPPTTAAPTTIAPSTTSAATTTAPITTPAPTTAAPTTVAPGGPIVFNFESGMEGWSLVHMNNAAFRRVHFDHHGYGMKPPADGDMVLQVFADNVQSGTVLAKSPRLQATKDMMTVRVTFWMNGTQTFPAQLKLRRQFNYETFEDSPIMILDPFGDQANTVWFSYTIHTPLVQGEKFFLSMEASLGGDIGNIVAVSSVVVDGVKVINDNNSTLFDFEGGLEGWTPGKMDGGVWELTTWDKLDSSLKIPKPEEGEKFLFASRSSIYSGVISLESPILNVGRGTSQRLMFRYYLRGSVTYPVVLRIRKKTPDGTYDPLPFIDLRKYGNVDYQQWMKLDEQIVIPVSPYETQYQLVIEVDLGSWSGNVVALDDFEIKPHDPSIPLKATH